MPVSADILAKFKVDNETKRQTEEHGAVDRLRAVVEQQNARFSAQNVMLDKMHDQNLEIKFDLASLQIQLRDLSLKQVNNIIFLYIIYTHKT